MAGVVGIVAKVFAGGFFKTIVGRLVLSLAIGAVQSRLAKLKAKKAAAAAAGIRTETTLAGSKNPVGFVLGRYATGGQLLAPPYAHGTNNRFRTYAISLGFIRGQALNSLIVNGEPVTLAGTSDPVFGTNVLGKYAGVMWVKYANGSQTVVDSFMSSYFGSHPERPWLSDMIGRETCIAYVTLDYNETVFPSEPTLRFDMNGIPLYDVRKDTTAGGSGAHRWNNPATWEHSLNPVVMIYNILRGITVVGIGTWGGEAEAEDFRFSEWSAAMNKADAVLSGTATARYQAGLEVFLSDQPMAVIEKLLAACGGEIADVGGTWRISIGDPGAAVLFFDDNDLMVTENSEFEPFPGLEETTNTVRVTYVDPAAMWETTEAPVQTDPAYIAEDDGRQLSVDLALDAVFRSSQAQDLGATLLADNRRFRSHGLPFPPSAVRLEPLDVISWDSAYNGYADKLFEIDKVSLSVLSRLPRVSCRERDPADYNFTSGDVVPFVPVSTVRPTPSVVLSSFAAAPYTITDGVSNRRPAIRLTWTGSLVTFATGVEYEVQTTTGAVKVAEGSSSAPASGQHIIAEGLVPNTAYQVRARLVAPLYDCPWSSWLNAATAAVYLNQFDLQVGSLSAISANIGLFVSGTPGGERMEISGDKIEIYDASNTLRVKIGDLS